MSIDVLLLEEGSSNFIFDESSFELLLESSFSPTTASILTYGFGSDGTSGEILVYGFELSSSGYNSGYLNHNIVTNDYFLYLENNDLILTEDDSRFYTLLLEVDYSEFERRSLRGMGVTITINTTNNGSGNITLANMTCSTSVTQNNANHGSVNSVPSFSGMYTRSSSYNGNSGSLNITLSSMGESLLLGTTNEIFGFYRNKQLGNLTLNSRGNLIKPNYGSFNNYIY